MSDVNSEKRIDPVFCQRAARVINSAFWYDGDPGKGGTDAEYIRWRQGKQTDRFFLEDAIDASKKYEDLKGKAKTLFDEVEAFNGKKAAQHKKQ